MLGRGESVESLEAKARDLAESSRVFEVKVERQTESTGMAMVRIVFPCWPLVLRGKRAFLCTVNLMRERAYLLACGGGGDRHNLKKKSPSPHPVVVLALEKKEREEESLP